MKKQTFLINKIPAVLYGEKHDKIYLFVHGQGGNKEEAERFAEIAVPNGFSVIGIDLAEHGERKGTKGGFDPWTAVPELQSVYSYLKERFQRIYLRANSIGAYFSMLAFKDLKIEKALFVSPIVDMEKLIFDMMGWTGVDEKELYEKKEIETNFGQTLSWRYLCYSKEHPIDGFNAPTFILYAGKDNLTNRETIDCFAKKHNAALSVYEPGEHWFHTPEQLKILSDWEQKNI